MIKKDNSNFIKTLILFGLILNLNSSILLSQKRDSLFSNSLFYNSLYDDNSFIDSASVANLYNDMVKASGAKKVRYLFKLLNGFYFYKPNLSKKFGEQALKISQKIGNDSLIAYSYHYTGIAYNYLGYKRIALNLYSKGLATGFAKRTDNYRSWVTFNSGIMYFELGEPDTAAQYFYEAIRINQKVGNKAFASKVHLELCRLFLSTQNFTESLKNYFEALKNINPLKDKRIAAQLYVQRFKVEIKKNNLDSAKFYFTSALNKGVALNDSSLISQIYFEYANNLFEAEFYFKSLYNYNAGFRYVNEDLYPVEYYSFLHGMGKANLYIGNLSKAKDQIFNAIKGLKLLPDKERMQQFELTLAKLYAKTSNWQKYNLHSKKAEKLRSAIIKETEINNINELKIIYETEQKDRKIELQNYQISSQKKQIILISSIAILIFGGFLIVYNFSKKLKRNNEELYKQNLELSKRWKELQGFYLKCTIPEDETKESKSLFQNIIKLFNEEKIYRRVDLSLDLLAKRLNSNVKYISGAIKDQTSMNFNTFMNTYRIEDAKDLLHDPKLNYWALEAIAEECGFNNQTSFYQAFKKNTGLTPTQYRKAKVA